MTATWMVGQRQRHLKWRALDKIEAGLAVACCASIIGFTSSVFCDVVTREIGRPWLWVQQLTTGLFVWGVFIGMALATRRNDHMYLSELLTATRGAKRVFLEVFSRVVVIGVALCMIVFGYQNFLHDMGSFRMPSLIPLGYYSIVIPISGTLITLFSVEQLINGLKNGFEDGAAETETGHE
jgi:TRAP-type C4-dicarboxylate transport system permease small subunit